MANDHSAFAIRCVNNSNAGAGSRERRIQTDYFPQICTSRARGYNGGWLEFSEKGTSAGSGSSAQYFHITFSGAIIII